MNIAKCSDYKYFKIYKKVISYIVLKTYAFYNKFIIVLLPVYISHVYGSNVKQSFR